MRSDIPPDTVRGSGWTFGTSRKRLPSHLPNSIHDRFIKWPSQGKAVENASKKVNQAARFTRLWLPDHDPSVGQVPLWLTIHDPVPSVGRVPELDQGQDQRISFGAPGFGAIRDARKDQNDRTVKPMTGAPKIGFSSYSAPDKGVLDRIRRTRSEVRTGNTQASRSGWRPGGSRRRRRWLQGQKRHRAGPDRAGRV